MDRIERVDRLVQMIGRGLGLQNQQLDEIVAIVDARLAANANFKKVANVRLALEIKVKTTGALSNKFRGQ